VNVDGRAEIALTGAIGGPGGWLTDIATNGPYQAALLGTLRSPRRNAVNPAREVIATYAEDGVEALLHLGGDFSVVLWDETTRRLIAMRDPLGGFPLYWTSLPGGGFALNTSLARLAAEHGRDTLDMRFIGAFLCASEAHNNELATRLTSHVGIERVMPGECLAFEPRADQPRHLGRWSWERAVASIEVRNHKDAAAELRERLDQTIASHLAAGARRDPTSPWAAHLSGGMDSTTICALAARRADGGSRNLHGLSLIYRRFPALSGETSLIEAAITSTGCTPHLIEADNLRAFDNPEHIPPHDEPAAVSLLTAAETRMAEVAVTAGCPVVLSGSGADFLFAAPPWHLADDLARLRFRHLFEAATVAADGQNADLRAVLWYQAVLPLIHGLPASACRGPIHRGPWSQYSGRQPPQWMRRDFLRREDPTNHHDETEEPGALRWSRSTRAALALVRAHRGNWHKWYVGAPLGVAVTYPYLDPVVAAFSLACIERLPPDPRRSKPLLADAIGSLLPEKITCRREKIDYDDPFFSGLIDNLPHLEHLARLPALADLGVIEPCILLECLHQTALGIAPAAPAINRLSKALALAKWLELREAVHRPARISESRTTVA